MSKGVFVLRAGDRANLNMAAVPQMSIQNQSAQFNRSFFSDCRLSEASAKPQDRSLKPLALTAATPARRESTRRKFYRNLILSQQSKKSNKIKKKISGSKRDSANR